MIDEVRKIPPLENISFLIIPVLALPPCLAAQPTGYSSRLLLLPCFLLCLTSFLFSVCEFRLLMNDVRVKLWKIQKPLVILRASKIQLEMRIWSSKWSRSVQICRSCEGRQSEGGLHKGHCDNKGSRKMNLPWSLGSCFEKVRQVIEEW